MKVQYVRLDEIAQISAGGTPRRSEENYWKNGDIPWIKISDITGKYVNTSEEFITEEGLNNSSAKLFPKGTILYTIFATVGECAILKTEATTNQAIAGLVVKSDEVLTEYLYYYLKSIKAEVVSKGRGVAQNNINLGILRSIEIPIPDVKQQRQIIELLNLSHNLIEKRKQQVEALLLLKQSIFLDMFGDPQLNEKNWNTGRIGDLTLSTQYGTSKKANEESGEYPILRMNNITYEGDVDLFDLKYIDLDEKDKEKYLVYPGELLFNRTNSRELVGKTGVYNGKEPVAFAGYLIKLMPNEKANSNFISGYLNSAYGKRVLLNMAKNSIGMSNINAKELRSIPIYIPPKQLQDKYANHVMKIDNQIKLFKNGEKNIKVLNNSLSQKAFNGELFQDKSEVCQSST